MTDKSHPERRKIVLAPRDYQPKRSELREEFEMPGASMDTLRQSFFRPLSIRAKRPESD